MEGVWEKNRIKYHNEPGIIPYLWCSQGKGDSENPVCRIYGKTERLETRYALKQVPIKKLVSHQGLVKKEIVEKYADERLEFPAVIVIKRFGKYYLLEGNHRVNAFLCLGRTTIKARVYRYRDLKRSYRLLRKIREQEWEENKHGQEVKEKGNA